MDDKFTERGVHFFVDYNSAAPADIVEPNFDKSMWFSNTGLHATNAAQSLLNFTVTLQAEKLEVGDVFVMRKTPPRSKQENPLLRPWTMQAKMTLFNSPNGVEASLPFIVAADGSHYKVVLFYLTEAVKLNIFADTGTTRYITTHANEIE